MKKTVQIKKIGAAILCLIMAIGVFAPGITALADNMSKRAKTMNFPAPVQSENPIFTYQYADPGIDVSAISEKFSPELVGTPIAGAPVISSVTIEAGPNDSVSVQGEGFAGGTVWLYGLDKEGNGMFTNPQVTFMDDTTFNAIIDLHYDYSMYMLWVESAAGALSYPVRINAAKSD